MYDIKIFLEDDGKVGARLNIGKQVIYGVGNNHKELMEDLKNGLELNLSEDNKNSKISRLYNYIISSKDNYAIKI